MMVMTTMATTMMRTGMIMMTAMTITATIITGTLTTLKMAKEGHNAHTNDLEVTYVFDRGSPKRIKTLTATAFTSFPDIENVDAVFLGDGTQKALRLTRKSATLRVD